MQNLQLIVVTIMMIISGGYGQFVPSEKFIGEPELVALVQNQPAGVAVSQDGRVFLTFPRFVASDVIPATVVEVINKNTTAAFPSLMLHDISSTPQEDIIVNAQSVTVDGLNRLWILDTGSIAFGPISRGGPKLIAVDLNTNMIVKKIIFQLNQGGVLDTTYLNDVRIDLRRGAEGIAFISDSSPRGAPGIIVVDLATEENWRFLSRDETTLPEVGLLPVIEGMPIRFRAEDGTTSHFAVGADGIALSSNGSSIFYSPLSSRRLYQVSADVLSNKEANEEDVKQTVIDLGERGGIADGLEADMDGNVYVTNLEHNAVLKRSGKTGEYETILSVPELLWPDSMSIGTDGFLYVAAGQLHRQPGFNQGVDKRQKPFAIFRVYVKSKPVLLL